MGFQSNVPLDQWHSTRDAYFFQLRYLTYTIFNLCADCSLKFKKDFSSPSLLSGSNHKNTLILRISLVVLVELPLPSFPVFSLWYISWAHILIAWQAYVLVIRYHLVLRYTELFMLKITCPGQKDDWNVLNVFFSGIPLFLFIFLDHYTTWVSRVC